LFLLHGLSPYKIENSLCFCFLYPYHILDQLVMAKKRWGGANFLLILCRRHLIFSHRPTQTDADYFCPVDPPTAPERSQPVRLGQSLSVPGGWRAGLPGQNPCSLSRKKESVLYFARRARQSLWRQVVATKVCVSLWLTPSFCVCLWLNLNGTKMDFLLCLQRFTLQSNYEHYSR
jgi:hypothetical protein